MLVWLLACSIDDPEPAGIVPPVAERLADRPDLALYAGRWAEVEALPDGAGWSRRAVCAGVEPAFVEVRGDGHTGWELVSGGPDGFVILAARAAISRDGGASISVDGQEPVELAWVEPKRIAAFPGLQGERRFASPEATDVPTSACPP